MSTQTHSMLESIRSGIRSLLCKLGSHDYDERRQSIASSNVGEITKTCQRCGKTVREYQPR